MDTTLPPLDNIIRPGLYRHYKRTHHTYRVLGTGRHSEDLSEMVVYENTATGDIWCRPAEMWHEVIKHGGVSMPRFQWIGES